MGFLDSLMREMARPFINQVLRDVKEDCDRRMSEGNIQFIIIERNKTDKQIDNQGDNSG